MEPGETKDRHTRKAIVKSAEKLFFKKGYRATSIESIAEHADVPVETLYSCFKSKEEIILALAGESSKELLAPLSLSEISDLNVEDAFWEFTEKLVDFISVYPRELIRELVGIYWDSEPNGLTSGFISLDSGMIKRLMEMIRTLKEAGKIKKDVEPQTAAFAMYGMASMAVLWYSADVSVTLVETRNSIAAMLGHFCRGILPDGKDA